MKTAVSFEDKRVALLLVDLQEEQRHDPLYSVAGFDDVLANAARLLAAARAAGRLVIHAAYRRDFTQCPPRRFEPVTSAGKPTFSDAADPLTAICREVAPGGSEPVIYKNDASAFCEGSLKPLLTEARIEWLAIAGVWTEACVAATVRDGIAQGFRVLLVKDACGSATRAMHETAIINLANRLYGGAIADTAGAMDLLEGKTIEAWVAERPVPILFNFTDAAERYAEL
ncbi:MAG: isochorismatase family protein [Parvibaculaceae bacterium]